MTFWSTAVPWPTTDQNNHSVCQIHGWPLCKSPELLRKDLQKRLRQIPCYCWLSLVFVQNLAQLSVLSIFPLKFSQCLFWSKGTCSGFIKWYMGLTPIFFFNRERIIMGFTLLQGLCKKPEWRDCVLPSWWPEKNVMSTRKLRFSDVTSLVSGRTNSKQWRQN